MYPLSTSCGEIGLILHHILNKIIGYKIDGVFVEVGANDGFTGSFTYNLAKIGWKGIYLEPIPSLFSQCCTHHREHNVKCFNIAAGASHDTLSISEAGTLSTMDTPTLNQYIESNWLKRPSVSHKVTVAPLTDVLEKENISHIDLLVIDVEGFETNVLRGFDINRFLPSIVIIEIADQHDTFIHNKICMAQFEEVRSYFSDHNYVLVANDIVDNVYVHRTMWSTDMQFEHMIKFPQFKS